MELSRFRVKDVSKILPIGFVNIYLFLISLFNSFCQNLPSLNIFSIVVVNIYLFPILFQKILPVGKVWDYPTLLIS